MNALRLFLISSSPTLTKMWFKEDIYDLRHLSAMSIKFHFGQNNSSSQIIKSASYTNWFREQESWKSIMAPSDLLTIRPRTNSPGHFPAPRAANGLFMPGCPARRRENFTASSFPLLLWSCNGTLCKQASSGTVNKCLQSDSRRGKHAFIDVALKI